MGGRSKLAESGGTEAVSARGSLRPPKVAYFSMEVALSETIPTYSGGLGVLAGDTLRSAADLGVPMVGVTLIYRKGYFHQELDAKGGQTEHAVSWRPDELLESLEPIATVTIEGRPVNLRCWRYDIVGVGGHIVPVYLLDASVRTNSDFDQTLTDHLYGGDEHYRLCQELILGVGGVEMLSKLGHHDIDTYHMNEGHSALLALRLVERRLAKQDNRFPSSEDIAEIRRHCVFTTHTPVPDGHDEFSGNLVRQVLGLNRATLLFSTGFTGNDRLNMTHLALHHSNYVNGVAMKHGEVSRAMFPNYRVKALTNGVHAATWTASSIQELFDREIPEWRHDNLYLRYAINISLAEIRQSHRDAKVKLLQAVEAETGEKLDPEAFTVGFARRATGYKRAPMFMADPARIRKIVESAGALQVVYGGKAHPRDDGGKANIRRIFEAAGELRDAVKIVYIPNYEWRWGRLITGGVDLRLNTPIKTREASGTSGMSAPSTASPHEHARRLVDRGPRGGPDRLVDRRQRRQRGRGDRLHVRQAREGDSAAVLQRPQRLRQRDAVLDRPQRVVLQHAAHVAAVHLQRLLDHGSGLTARGRSVQA